MRGSSGGSKNSHTRSTIPQEPAARVHEPIPLCLRTANRANADTSQKRPLADFRNGRNKLRVDGKGLSGAGALSGESKRKVVMVNAVRRQGDGHAGIVRCGGPFDAALQSGARRNKPIVASAVLIERCDEIVGANGIGHLRTERGDELNLDAVLQINPEIALV